MKQALDEIELLRKKFKSEISEKTKNMIRKSQIFFEVPDTEAFEMEKVGETTHREKVEMNRNLRRRGPTSNEAFKGKVSIFEAPEVVQRAIEKGNQLKMIKSHYPEDYEEKMEGLVKELQE